MTESWDPARWRDAFGAASAARDRDRLRALRSAVFRGTVDVVRRRGYETAQAQLKLNARGEYAALHAGTRYHAATDELVVPAARRERFETEVSVVAGDCLEQARRMAEAGHAPAVLNMASRRNPGGGALSGAGAQEENLFRRSSLLWSLYQFAPYASQYDVPPSPDGHRYPIPRESGGIYSPATWIFRSSEDTGYAFLDDPFQVAFLTVPAISRPDLEERHGEPRLTPTMAEATLRKIRAILRIAAYHEHADLVLSAFGCGAFRNPPRHIAQLFAAALGEPEIAGVFRRIVFAIVDDHNAFRETNPEGNLVPFQAELGAGGHADGLRQSVPGDAPV